MALKFEKAKFQSQLNPILLIYLDKPLDSRLHWRAFLNLFWSPTIVQHLQGTLLHSNSTEVTGLEIATTCTGSFLSQDANIVSGRFVFLVPF